MTAIEDNSSSHVVRRNIIIGALVAMLLSALDQSIVAPALPTIGRQLGDAVYLPWVVTAYLITATAVTPLYGKLADVHGRKRVVYAGIAIFVAGSIIAALAPTMLILILGRAVQGIGGGGLIALGQTMIADVVSPRERGRYMGYISTMWATASVGGPILGGFFAEHLHWSVIFWVNLPLSLAAVLIMHRPLRHLPKGNVRRRLDITGSLLMLAGTTLLMLTLTWGGGTFPWLSVPILAMLAGAGAFALMFGWHINRIPEPLIPLDVLRNPVVASAAATLFLMIGAYTALAIYTPIYLQRVHGLSASASGLALVGLLAGSTAGAWMTGRLMTRIRHYKRVPLIGLSTAAMVMAVIALGVDRLHLAAFELLLAIAGIGAGTLFPVATISVQNAVPQHNMGIATAVLAFLRSLGSAIGVAVIGAIALGGGSFGGEAGPSTGDTSVGMFFAIYLSAAVIFAMAVMALATMRELPLRTSAPLRTASAAANE
ncbi:MDR family MFS transporter [Marinivivus vitaminiproducens]|uniref:MDR family MFS transporter n=1 Tax=Marinivivus vitaminiproducens TaxID=3035935 RepID=UPI0027A4F131|nr:MDR family MFS transporter [Geminicoccaceae bacterium SCSIO 64248]